MRNPSEKIKYFIPLLLMGISVSSASGTMLRKSGCFVSSQQQKFLCVRTVNKKPMITPQFSTSFRWNSSGEKKVSSPKELRALASSLMPLLKTMQECIRDIDTLQKNTSQQVSNISYDSTVKNLPKRTHDELKTKDQIFEGLICDIAKNVSKDKSIDSAALKDILTVYKDLSTINPDGITRVLSGEVNTKKSSIYNAVNKYLKAKDLNIEKMRDMFKKLEKSLGQDPFELAQNVVSLGFDKREALYYSIIESVRDDIQPKDPVSMIVDGANPLYPIDSAEVTEVINLYNALDKSINPDGITRVLSGEVNTKKSSIYNAVNKYLKAKDLNFEKMRDMFRRVSESLNQRIVDLFDESFFLDAKIRKAMVTGSNVNKLSLENVSEDKKSIAMIKPVVKYERQLDKSNNSSYFLYAKDGKYIIHTDDMNRFNKLYEILSQQGFKSKSITDALKKFSPITTSIKTPLYEAIKEIKGTCESGCSREVNREYFRKLYWAIHKGNSRICVFNTTHDPSGRLLRLYALLPEYSGKSITDVLKKSTHEKVTTSISQDLESAISLIQKEAILEGSNEEIDLAYFRRLFSSAVEIRERENQKMNT